MTSCDKRGIRYKLFPNLVSFGPLSIFSKFLKFYFFNKESYNNTHSREPTYMT